jgi:hypothetical protein
MHGSVFAIAKMNFNKKFTSKIYFLQCIVSQKVNEWQTLEKSIYSDISFSFVKNLSLEVRDPSLTPFRI